MATTYTEYLQIPKHDPTDPFDIALINEGFDKTEAGILAAYRGMAAYNLLDNSDFRNPVNQRKPGTVTDRAVYVADRWVFDHAEGTTANATADKTVGWIYMNRSSGTGFYSLRQSVSSISMRNKKLTFAVDCNSYGASFNLQVVDEEWNLVAEQYCTARNGVACMTFDAGSNTFLRFVIYPSANEFGIRWAAVYEGEYVLDNLPSYVPKGYTAELLECQVYFHLYATQAARPTHGLDCSPPMRINNPTQGTIVIDDATYYYNSADL